MVQEGGQAFDDGEPQAHALIAIPFRIAELIELLKDVLLFIRRNAAAGIEHLDAHACPAPAAHDDASALGVGHCVRDHVAQHTRSNSTGSLSTARLVR